jgi:hypothetical protein
MSTTPGPVFQPPRNELPASPGSASPEEPGLSFDWARDLTLEEYRYGVELGTFRNEEDYRLGRHHRWGLQCTKEQATRMHINGALAEIGGAAILKLTFRSTQLREPDLPCKIQVRAISTITHSLLLHPDDPDLERFILVYRKEKSRRCELLRWTVAGDVKLRRYWKDPKGGRPAFFVPQSALVRPREELLWLLRVEGAWRGRAEKCNEKP